MVETAAEHAKLGLGTVGDDATKAARGKADRRLEKNRGALWLGAGDRGRHRKTIGARQARRTGTRPREAKYHHFELASAAFQIAIVLASATIITGIIALAWVSVTLTLAGVAITALGLSLPHLLRLP